MLAQEEVQTEADGDARPLYFRMVVLGLLVKLGISGNILDLFFNYSDPGGSFILKIHPGTYILLALAAAATPDVYRRTSLKGNPLPIAAVGLVGTVLFLMLWAVAQRHTTGLGYLVDTTLMGPAVLVCLAALSPEQRLTCCRAGFVLMGISCAITIVEFATKIRIMPYGYVEASFRPSGLFGHPLSTAAYSLAVLPALFLVAMPPRVRWVMFFALGMTVFASQARFASILCALAMPGLILISLRRGIRSGSTPPAMVGLVVSMGLILIPAAIGVMLQFGFFERLSEGLVDSSTLARVNIYNIFNYLTDREFWFGTDLDRANYFLKFGLKLDHIESAIVVFIISFGAIGATILLAALAFFAFALSFRAPLHAKLVVILYVVVTMSANGLSSKGPGLAFLTLFTFGAATSAAGTGRTTLAGSSLLGARPNRPPQFAG